MSTATLTEPTLFRMDTGPGWRDRDDDAIGQGCSGVQVDVRRGRRADVTGIGGEKRPLRGRDGGQVEDDRADAGARHRAAGRAHVEGERVAGDDGSCAGRVALVRGTPLPDARVSQMRTGEDRVVEPRRCRLHVPLDVQRHVDRAESIEDVELARGAHSNLDQVGDDGPGGRVEVRGRVSRAVREEREECALGRRDGGDVDDDREHAGRGSRTKAVDGDDARGPLRDRALTGARAARVALVAGDAADPPVVCRKPGRA